MPVDDRPPSWHANELPGLRIAEHGLFLEVVIDRQNRRNALTPELITSLMGVLDTVARERKLRAVVLTGAGEKAFCAGFDLEMIKSVGRSNAGAERDLVDRLASRVRDLPQPVIAAVNGAAVGAGCDLAVACDIRLGSPGSRFGMPPARLGILYGSQGVERLVRVVGTPAAKELLLTGALIDADRAHHLGLLSAVVPQTALLVEAHRMAEAIAANAPLSVAGSKRMVDLLAMPVPLSEDVREALEQIQSTVWNSQDAVEGAHAHRERRTPNFEGR